LLSLRVDEKETMNAYVWQSALVIWWLDKNSLLLVLVFTGANYVE
jgi:hypothetical protein